MWKIEMLLFFVMSLDFVFLVQPRDLELDKHLKLEGIVKNPKAKNVEDVYCVDVYKQPAFQNPLLKNHKLQWEPTTLPNNLTSALFKGVNRTNSASKNSLCLPNYIPIRKAPKKIFNDSTRNGENNSLLYQFALLEMIHDPDDMFYGASTHIKLDHPHCENGQNSGVSVWIASDNSDKKNVIKAGWMVYPEIYGDAEAHFSIYWTSDGFHQTGCYDHLCPGFVQLSNDIILGESLVPYRGRHKWYTAFLFIFQDISTKNWWLVGHDVDTLVNYYMGYWPKELFSRFDQGGTVLNFGGSTMARAGQQFPPMGDGHFPNGLPKDSTYFGKIHYVNKSNYIVSPRRMGAKIHIDNPNCYGLIYAENEGADYENILYVGGPGGKC